MAAHNGRKENFRPALFSSPFEFEKLYNKYIKQRWLTKERKIQNGKGDD